MRLNPVIGTNAMRILVAEDDESIAKQFQLIIENSGHTVTLTSDGEECVDAYSQAISELPDTSEDYLAQHPPFDLVQLDSRMPKMDGITAAKLIIKMNRHQRIIFVSAYAPSTIKRALPDIPGLEVITKPFELEKLLATIQLQGRS